MDRPRLIVVGASIGGVVALRSLVRHLPRELLAPVLVVLHVGSNPSVLPELLAAKSALPCRHAVDGEPLRDGHLLVAPPDHHLLVEGNLVRLSRGPKEHHTRPAIDPLFRSAALARGEGVIGVVLSGLLDDGTAGLQAIKARGGIAIVQDPADAVEPSMPMSALKYVRVDHCVSIERLAPLLAELAARATAPALPAAAELQHEHALSLMHGDAMKHLNAIATPSTFVCPDCQGALWEIKGTRPPRYRCHVGHAFTLRSLEHSQSDATDEALWTAIRALQEKQLLLTRLAEERLREQDEREAQRLRAAAEDTQRHAELLRELTRSVPNVTAEA
jgi:two-component system chemotaxis response regulator CheB